jgi:4-hydroxy-tetrahydrodipicolinate synthase
VIAAQAAILDGMPALGAILTAVITPFDADGRVDEDAFVAVQQHVCATGSDGIVVAGTTGEAPTLTDEEHLRVIELAVRERPAGTTVVAGTGSNDTRHAVHLTERATELGVDGILTVTPYYNRPTPRGILAHFGEVARATDRPIVLYNIPSRTGTDMPNELLAELAQLPGISAVKQANNANLAMVDGLELYAGNDESVARALDLGGVGGICVATHLLGPLFRALVDEPARRAEVQEELMGYLPALNRANPVSIKAALELAGIAPGTLRLPLVEADETERAEIRATLERAGVLEAARH